MPAGFGRLVVALSGLTLVVAGLSGPSGLSAQGTPPVQGQPPPDAAQGRGGGAGRGRGTTFPAQQRVLADQAVLDRGKQVYGIHCRSCHGVDLRGGDMGGPNLLRSDVMLNDQNGELLRPVLQGSRASGGMTAIDLPESDGTAVAAYIHSVLATARGQGAPPAGPLPELNLLVGNADEGRAYFEAKCAACHSATGDLSGIGTRVPNVMQLQNLWVAGGRGGRGGAAGAVETAGGNPVLPGRSAAKASVVLPDGSRVEGWLERLDDFNVTLLFADGTRRSFRRTTETPKIDIVDPLAAHKSMLQVHTDRDMHNVTAYLTTLK